MRLLGREVRHLIVDQDHTGSIPVGAANVYLDGFIREARGCRDDGQPGE